MVSVTLAWVLQDDASPTERVVQAKAGISLMRAAVDSGITGIAADCGGMLTCATCHVYVREPWLERLPAATEEELEMLDFVAAERKTGSRLSCQLMLTDALDGLTVDLPADQY